MYVDLGSLSYVPKKKPCDFVITSVKGTKNWGYVENPVHSLPPNTSCRYHFQGRRYQNVWLSFVKYHASSWDPNVYHLEMECNAKLTILDGPTRAPNGQQVNFFSSICIFNCFYGIICARLFYFYFYFFEF